MAAAQEAVRLLRARVQGEGGLIAVAPHGEVGFAHNTQVMSRAWSRLDGTIVAAL
jgi:beta-aspartyl-peptidase (threonine type)